MLAVVSEHSFVERTLTSAILIRKRDVAKDRPEKISLAQMMYSDLTLDGNMTINTCSRLITILSTDSFNVVEFLTEDNTVT